MKKLENLVKLITLIGFASCGVIEPVNERPVARISNQPYTIERNNSIYINNSIRFDGSDSHDWDGKIVSYSWDFGDGNFGTGKRINHTYRTVGNYRACLVVQDNDDAKDSACIKVDVLPR